MNKDNTDGDNMVSEYTDKESNYGVSDDRYIDASYLASYVRQLEKRVKTIETEKKLLDAERMRLERELNSVRAELERLRLPPRACLASRRRSCRLRGYVVPGTAEGAAWRPALGAGKLASVELARWGAYSRSIP